MKSMYYILDEAGRAVAEPDVERWARWYVIANRKVAETMMPDGARISTVFLGLDHQYGDGGPPILWQTTMVFGGPLNEKQARCSGSREQAEAMHAAMVERVKAI